LYKNTTKNRAATAVFPILKLLWFFRRNSFGTNWKINAAPIPLRPEKPPSPKREKATAQNKKFSRINGAEECDARDDDSSTEAGKKITKNRIWQMLVK
jgi:hypothetical protein